MIAISVYFILGITCGVLSGELIFTIIAAAVLISAICVTLMSGTSGIGAWLYCLSMIGAFNVGLAMMLGVRYARRFIKRKRQLRAEDNSPLPNVK